MNEEGAPAYLAPTEGPEDGSLDEQEESMENEGPEEMENFEDEANDQEMNPEENPA